MEVGTWVSQPVAAPLHIGEEVTIIIWAQTRNGTWSDRFPTPFLCDFNFLLYAGDSREPFVKIVLRNISIGREPVAIRAYSLIPEYENITLEPGDPISFSISAKSHGEALLCYGSKDHPSRFHIDTDSIKITSVEHNGGALGFCYQDSFSAPWDKLYIEVRIDGNNVELMNITSMMDSQNESRIIIMNHSTNKNELEVLIRLSYDPGGNRTIKIERRIYLDGDEADLHHIPIGFQMVFLILAVIISQFIFGRKIQSN